MFVQPSFDRPDLQSNARSTPESTQPRCHMQAHTQYVSHAHTKNNHAITQYSVPQPACELEPTISCSSLCRPARAAVRRAMADELPVCGGRTAAGAARSRWGETLKHPQLDLAPATSARNTAEDDSRIQGTQREAAAAASEAAAAQNARTRQEPVRTHTDSSRGARANTKPARESSSIHHHPPTRGTQRHAAAGPGTQHSTRATQPPVQQHEHAAAVGGGRIR